MAYGAGRCYAREHCARYWGRGIMAAGEHEAVDGVASGAGHMMMMPGANHHDEYHEPESCDNVGARGSLCDSGMPQWSWHTSAAE
eukprot:972913-Rhodomonas_salina.1